MIKKHAITIILAIITLITVSITVKTKAEPKTGPRIVLIESLTINETHLTIVSIDKKEYLISSDGGIIRIE